MNTGRPTDPTALAFARGALTRRDLLRRAGVAGGVLAGSGLLAACGSGGSSWDRPPEAPPRPRASVGTTPADMAPSWTFSNWPLYIDTEGKTKHPSLDQFDKAFTTTTKYLEDIEDNESFFGQVKAQLEAGQDIKRDIVVLTDWMAGKWILLGYAEKLDKSALPNVRRTSCRPGRAARSTPATSTWCRGSRGMTGIAYNTEADRRQLTSVNDLSIRSSRARSTLLTEMRDTVGLFMLASGHRPRRSCTVDDAQPAVDAIQKAGRARPDPPASPATTTSSDLAKGNVVACMAWSGDVVQLQLDNPDLEFVDPDEGGMLWTDNMHDPEDDATNPSNAQACDQLLLRPAERRAGRGLGQVHLPGQGRRGSADREGRPSSPTTR